MEACAVLADTDAVAKPEEKMDLRGDSKLLPMFVGSRTGASSIGPVEAVLLG